MVELDVLQLCSKCCTNDKCNNFVLQGQSESAAVNLVASLSLLAIAAVVAMVM